MAAQPPQATPETMTEATETPTPERETTPALGVGLQRRVIQMAPVGLNVLASLLWWNLDGDWLLAGFHAASAVFMTWVAGWPASQSV